jgi:hypothetical protein
MGEEQYVYSSHEKSGSGMYLLVAVVEGGAQAAGWHFRKVFGLDAFVDGAV